MEQSGFWSIFWKAVGVLEEPFLQSWSDSGYSRGAEISWQVLSVSIWTGPVNSNVVAEEIAKSVSRDNRLQSYIAYGGPLWLSSIILGEANATTYHSLSWSLTKKSSWRPHTKNFVVYKPLQNFCWFFSFLSIHLQVFVAFILFHSMYSRNFSRYFDSMTKKKDMTKQAF